MEIDIFKNIFKPYKVCVLLEGVQNYHICRFEYSGPLRIEELSKKMAEKANTSAGIEMLLKVLVKTTQVYKGNYKAVNRRSVTGVGDIFPMEGYHNLKVNTREIIAYEKLKKPEVVTGRFRGREKVKLYEQLVESFRVDVPSGELLMTFNFDEYNQHY